MTVIDDLLANSRAYAEAFDGGGMTTSPAGRVAVVACMDARVDVYRMLGLDVGQAHVIRNAGGVVTEDVIRSLTISQRLLGTDQIILIHHSDCGMARFRDDDVKDEIMAEVGIRPPFALESFRDPEADVRQSIARIQASPFLPHKEGVRGFVFDVTTGVLNEIIPG